MWAISVRQRVAGPGQLRGVLRFGSCSPPECSAVARLVGDCQYAGLALSRFFWTAEIWFAPYGLFWIWLIIIASAFSCCGPANLLISEFKQTCPVDAYEPAASEHDRQRLSG